MLKKIKSRLLAGGAVMILATSVVSSCNDYLDIVPNDGIATVEMAFNMRSQAIKYLASCYSYLPSVTPGQLDYPGFSGGESFFVASDMLSYSGWTPKCEPIIHGLQNVTSPYNYDFQSMYQAFRYCNDFVANIQSVPDMEQWEKDQWAAEAKVLNAYYLFYTIRKWGPVPIVRENLPVSAGIEESKVYRENIDTCFNYAMHLIDEALPFLYDKEMSMNELGRITKPIAAMLKAKIAVTAASPLFNNNADQAALVDSKGTQLFPTKTAEEEKQRWVDAMQICKDAIEICHKSGHELYYYDGSFRGDDHITQELTLREAICEDWNVETVWGNTQNYSNNNTFQRIMAANNNIEKYADLWGLLGGQQYNGVPLRVAELFYTKHGVPIEDDLERQGVDMTALRVGTASEDERWYIQEGYTTAELHFDREPRFYADLGFDGGYCLSSINNNQQPSNLPKYKRGTNVSYVTGYNCKKLIKYSLVVNSSSSYSITKYIYPMFRLADLYLLYAEAINEAEGPSGAHAADLFNYMDLIRTRAGIPGVKEAWDTYSDSPGKYNTKDGMREIIHQERNIELVFEGEHFWDLRRWKEAPKELSKGITGWDFAKQSSAEGYYKVTTLLETSFTQKDYFWPFSTATLENNTNLVQNLGW